jgi:hypothetical protein
VQTGEGQAGLELHALGSQNVRTGGQPSLAAASNKAVGAWNVGGPRDAVLI